MRGFKNITCMLLVVIMVFSLAACGKSGDGDGGAADKGGAYTTKEVELSKENISINNIAVANDVVYITYYDSDAYTQGKEEATQNTSPKTKLASVKVDGSDFTEIPYESKLDYIQKIYIDEQDNIWLLEYSYVANDPDSDEAEGDEGDASGSSEIQNGTEKYALVKIDANGNELSTNTDLSVLQSSAAEDEGISLQDMVIDKDGNIYLSLYYYGGNSSKSSVFVLDSSGKELFDLEVEWAESFVKTTEGTVCLPVEDSDDSLIKEIDVSKKAWGKEYSVGDSYHYGIFTGKDYDFNMYDGSKLYGYDIKSGKTTTVLNMVDAGVADSDLNSVAALSEGQYIYISYDNEKDGASLVLLVPVDEALNANKTEITLACFYLDYSLRKGISKFNNSSEEYRISVTEYSEYSTEKDWTAGATKLNTEIAAGNIPDIICSSDMLPVQQYIKKGILEDLYPYIDRDEELSRDSFLPNIISELETDGKLYELAPFFFLSSLVGSSDIVGTEMGWTFDELMDVSDSLPEGTTLFGPYFTKSLIIEYIMFANSSQFVDWNAGKCNFNSEDFIRLLELANTLPADYDFSDESDENVDEYTLVHEGRQALAQVTLTDPSSIQIYDKLFDGKANYIGFPVNEGSGTTISLNVSVGISSASKNKDAAWEFIRELFTEGYQTGGYFGFPTNKAGFDAAMKKSMEKEVDNDGNEISMGGISMGGFSLELYASTQEDVDALAALVDSASGITRYDQSLNDIIAEETTAYFEGAQTAQRTAEIIQDRVTKYVNE